MAIQDSFGLTLSGATGAALDPYEKALQLLRCYTGDPLAACDAALAAAPGFTMAHILRAWLHLLGTEPAALDVARQSHASASRLATNDRERAHITAIGQLLDGQWHDAARTLEDATLASPRDALALQVGHQLDFFTGASRMLRDRIARALPAWSTADPAYHALLSMHAFGLEECADYARAEAAGRRAVELEPRDGWGQHAVAHVLEMQGRSGDGIAWMRAGSQPWAEDSFFAVHNWWHLALYHLERQEFAEILGLFDGPIFGARSSVVLDLVDASALLWRLELCGAAVGERWRAVAENWQPMAQAGNYAFNDAHAVMAFLGAGRGELVREVLQTQQRLIAGGRGDNVQFTARVGHPLCRALIAFAEQDYATCIELLRPLRSIAALFGGSHAQRDLLDLTLLAAAERGRQHGLARALIAERRAAKPGSPLVGAFAQRIEHGKAA